MVYSCGHLCILFDTMSCLFFFNQKTAYDMRISDWSSDVCSSDLTALSQSLHLQPPHLCVDAAAPDRGSFARPELGAWPRAGERLDIARRGRPGGDRPDLTRREGCAPALDRQSTRLNSSH